MLDMTTSEWLALSAFEQGQRAARWRATYASSLKSELHKQLDVGGVSFEMSLIPPGRFVMGSEPDEDGRSPYEMLPTTVELTRPFWLAKYNVTKAQWRELTGEEPWRGLEYVSDDPSSPAVYVSWNDAQKLLSARAMGLRLPTETEWEYACRAGTTTRFYWGDDFAHTVIDEYAWYEKNAWQAGARFAHPVGQKKPNAWELYDISGNVLEWCEDEYQGGRCGPPGSSAHTRLVVRGGFFSFWAARCRSAYRCSCTSSLRDSLLGIRLAADIAA